MIFKLIRSNWLLAVFTITALGFGLWGWLAQADALGLSFSDALYHSIGAFLLSDIYQKSDVWNADWRLDVARWSGVIAFVLGATKAILALLAKQFQHFTARLRSGHFMLIGDDVFAETLAQAALADGKQVTWLASSEAQSAKNHESLFVLHGEWDIAQAEQFGLQRAENVAIATNDDSFVIACARQIRQKVPIENPLKIFVTIHSPWIAMRIDELGGISGVSLFSQAQAAVRQAHRRHPPFLLAKKQNHKRIHTVIFGFGLHGEAVLIDTLLSSLTTYLGKPLFTIIDPHADAIKNSLALRYPELKKSADITIIKGTLDGADICLSEADILALGKQDPVSVTYICLPNKTLSLAAGLAIQSLAQRDGWTTGPIFIKLSAHQALPNVQAGVSDLKPAQLISFGGLDNLVADTGIFSNDTDSLARILHNRYRQVAPKDKEANVPWEELSEDFKDSNRRQLIHIPAKLSSAGMELESWLRSADKNPQHTTLPEGGNLLADEAMVKKLAILEHERWMADRRINGWRYGVKKIPKKRLHTDLVPYEELSADSQSYDRMVIETLSKALQLKDRDKV